MRRESVPGATRAADLMVREDVGRLPVVTRDRARPVVGILTRSDLLRATSVVWRRQRVCRIAKKNVPHG